MSYPLRSPKGVFGNIMTEQLIGEMDTDQIRQTGLFSTVLIRCLENIKKKNNGKRKIMGSALNY
jgi:predicted DNA-binding ribbon-helix-helix protein